MAFIVVAVSVVLIVIIVVISKKESFGNNTLGLLFTRQFQIQPVTGKTASPIFNTLLNYNPGNEQLFIGDQCLTTSNSPGGAFMSKCLNYAPQQQFVYDETNQVIANPYYGLCLQNDNTFVNCPSQLFSVAANTDPNAVSTISDALKFNLI